MTKLAAAISFAIAIMVPSVAFAYVGPGAGLSLIGALWALIAAIATALLFVVAWPVRRMLRKRSAAAKSGVDNRDVRTTVERKSDEAAR